MDNGINSLYQKIYHNLRRVSFIAIRLQRSYSEKVLRFQ